MQNDCCFGLASVQPGRIRFCWDHLCNDSSIVLAYRAAEAQLLAEL